MYKFSTAFIVPVLLTCMHASATITLSALTEHDNPMVTLRWNMVDYPGSTAYILYKSTDGMTWEPAAANPVFRDYTAATILAYRDHFTDENQLYYRVKVYDQNENIVEVSNTTKVTNPVEERYRVHKAADETEESPVNDEITDNNEAAGKNIHGNDEVSTSNTGALWQIVPNPVHDMLYLNYIRKAKFKDVINVIIQNATGRVVIKFRAASNNSRLRIPVSKLHTGVYFIKISIGNQQQLNSRFIKE